MSARVDARHAAEREQVYADALTLAIESPGTVCVDQRHYQRGRHPVPYRTGYVHHYRQPGEHYHATLAQLEGCDR